MLTINPITYNIYNRQIPRQQQPSFGHRLPNAVFYEIRDIPGLTCGICGDKMLTSDEITKFLKSFAAGSKRALENHALDRFRGNEGFTFIEKLSALEPKKTIRSLIDKEEVREEIYKLKPNVRFQVKQIAMHADGISIKAPQAIKKINKYYNNFSEQYKDILDLMHIYSLRFPNNTFAEIFNKPEIIEKHTKINQLIQKEISSRKISVFKRLKEVLNVLPDEDKRALQDTNSHAITVLNKDIYQPDIKEAKIKDLYRTFIENCTNKNVEKEITNIIKDLPYEGLSADKFVIDSVQNKKTDMDIIEVIVRELQATWEHYKPKSKNGTNEIDNMVILCKKCNTKRANMPYPFMLKVFPEMKQNLQKQINKVLTFIMHGKLANHEKYPVGIKNTVLKETDNMINLNITKYLKFREEKAAEKLKRTEAALSRDKLKYNEANKNVEELDVKIEEVKTLLRQLQKQRSKAQQTFKEAEDAKQFSQNAFENNQESLRQIQKEIKTDEKLNQEYKKAKKK